MPKLIDSAIDKAGEAHSVNPLSDFSQTQKWPWAWLLAKYTKSKREARSKIDISGTHRYSSEASQNMAIVSQSHVHDGEGSY